MHGAEEPERRWPPVVRVLLGAALPLAVVGGLLAFGVTEHRSSSARYVRSYFGQPYPAALELKSQLGTVLLGLALIQLLLALWMYGRLPGVGAGQRPAHLAHRIGGL